MSRRLRRFLAVALFTVMLSTPFLAPARSVAIAGAGEISTMSLEPPNTEVAMGSGPFSVSVQVDEAASLGAYEFAIAYDSRLLAFAGVSDSGFLGSTGRAIQCIAPQDVPSDAGNVNVVIFACGSVGVIEGSVGQDGPTGPGTLAVLTFQPAYPGSAAISLVGANGEYRVNSSLAGHTSLSGVESCPAPGQCNLPAILVAVVDASVTVTGPPPDTDGDGVPDLEDNCPTDANSDQLNTDAIGMPGDATVPNDDRLGDACDPDDDNDGILDPQEAAGCNGSGPLDALASDSDGDRVMDGAECDLGSNPTDPASRPAIVATYDSDGDGVNNWIEYVGYNTDFLSSDTDGDACDDGLEIGSINGDLSVNSGDLATVASAFATSSLRADVTRDGRVDVLDLWLVARLAGSCDG